MYFKCVYVCIISTSVPNSVLVVRFKELQFCADTDKLIILSPWAGCSAAPAVICMRPTLLTVAAGTPGGAGEGGQGMVD